MCRSYLWIMIRILSAAITIMEKEITADITVMEKSAATDTAASKELQNSLCIQKNMCAEGAFYMV